MDLPMLLVSGAIAGTLAGLLGIGGGIIIVPIVTLLFETQGLAHGLAIKMALGTSLATIIVTAISSIYTHHRKAAVEWGLFKIMAPGVLVGSLIGASVANNAITANTTAIGLDAVLDDDVAGIHKFICSSYGKIRFQSCFISTTVQPCLPASSRALSRRPTED